jgi:hypothetical protein
METPICEATTCKWKGRAMVPYTPATPEQEFSVAGGGEWWCCENCMSSTLLPGSELTAFLESMKPKEQGQLLLRPNR